MSLYALEEVCEGCRHAHWMRGERRTAFDYCALDMEYAVDHARGRCESKEAEHPTEENDRG